MSNSKKTETTPAEDIFRSYNRAELAGRLAADPDLRYTGSGKAVCRLRIATNDTRVTQFHDAVAWEQLAETAAETFTKGSKIIVSGRIQTRSWDAADGSKRYATEIVASSLSAA